MLVTLSYHQGDQDQTEKLAGWVEELGGCKNHQLLIGQDTSVTNADKVTESFQRAFGKVEILSIKNPFHQWPHAPNHAYATLARHIENNKLAPFFFWIESDAIPLSNKWLDDPEAEYKQAGKPFMGDFVHVVGEPNFIDHMSGVAIYPGNMLKHAGIALISNEVAWDIEAASLIIRKMHRTKLIQHFVPPRDTEHPEGWKHHKFESLEQMKREIRPEAVVFHSDKTGSAIDLLRAEKNNYENENGKSEWQVIRSLSSEETEPGKREQKNLSLETQRELVASETGSETQSKSGVRSSSQVWEDNKAVNLQPMPKADREEAPARSSCGLQQETGRDLALPKLPQAQFTCDIFIKSYPPDYEWLSYCLRSIEKFATGFRQIVLVVPETPDDKYSFGTGIIKTPQVNRIETVESGDLYLYQQAIKATAHEFTDADYILHIDSDCVLTQPITPDSFFQDGKPVWYMTSYTETKTPWKPITEKFLGESVEYEFMRRFPLLVPRSLHRIASEFCLTKHGMPLTNYILSQPNKEYSEFNALGALAYSRARDEFHWIDTTKAELPEPFAIQFWSHTPIDNHREQIEKILSGECGKQTPGLLDRGESLEGMTGVSSLTAAKAVPESDSESSDSPAQAIRQTKEGIWIINGDEFISKWVEEKGALQHDYQTLPLVLPEIPVGGTVIDVGANIGDTTQPFLERVGPTGQVLAFEPNPDAYECLKRNLAVYSNAYLYDHAISDKMEVSPLIRDSNAGASYMLEPARFGKVCGINVSCARIDSFRADRCDFIKIDTEGFELRVLKGAEQTITKFRPKMWIEINEQALRRQGTGSIQVLAWLWYNDYLWWPLNQANLEQPWPQFDILAQPRPIGKEGDASCPITSDVCNAAPTVQPTSAAEKQGELNEMRDLAETATADNCRTIHNQRLEIESLRDELMRLAVEPLPAKPIQPWQSQDETKAELHRLARELKNFCTAPRRTAIVRDILKKEKVT